MSYFRDPRAVCVLIWAIQFRHSRNNLLALDTEQRASRNVSQREYQDNNVMQSIVPRLGVEPTWTP